jgi:hypothetical protein
VGFARAARLMRRFTVERHTSRYRMSKSPAKVNELIAKEFNGKKENEEEKE